MLLADKSRRRAKNDQLFFPWGEPPRKRRVQTKKQEELKTTPLKSGTEEDLREMCALLHQIAQKYVPRTSFRDRETLVQCTKLLQDQNVKIEVADDLKARVADFNPVVVTHAPQYRLMRNRALAALATVADLAAKAPSKGSHDYQQGMRNAFQIASDIAIFFLEDIESAYEFRR